MNPIKTAAITQMRIFALALVTFLILGAGRASAAISIGAGEIDTGSITYTGVDTYSIPVNVAKSTIFVSVGETGTHVNHFVPEISVYRSGHTAACATDQTYFVACTLDGSTVVVDTWYVDVSCFGCGSTVTGNYQITIFVTPGTNSVSGGNAGGAMVPTQDDAGSITRGDTDIFDFTANGTTGNISTTKVTATGGTGFTPQFNVMSPMTATGNLQGGNWCATNCSLSVYTTGLAGQWQTNVFKRSGSDVADSDTMNQSGTGTEASADPLPDGSPGLGCDASVSNQSPSEAPLPAAQVQGCSSDGNVVVGNK